MLAYFLQFWDLEDSNLPYEDFIRLFGTIGCFECESLFEIFDHNGGTIGISSSSPLFTALRRLRDRRANPDHFQLLLSHTLEVDATQHTGATLLAIAPDYVHHSQIGSVARALLHAGADARSTDKQGCGILWHYCSSFSGCRGFLSDEKSEESIVNLLVELIAQGASPSGSKTWSPTDLALAPTFWVLWCRALETAGIDIESLLKHDDEAQGLQSPSSQDVGELLGDLTSPRVASSEILCDNRLHGICERCEEGIGPYYFRPPFDIYFHFIAPATKRHQAVYRHPNGLPCSNYFSVNTCARKDHRMNGTPIQTKEARSIRKWAAYRLWKDGYLNTPEHAEFWAADVITQEALDSFDYLSAVRL